jgi:hypothetical protein
MLIEMFTTAIALTGIRIVPTIPDNFARPRLLPFLKALLIRMYWHVQNGRPVALGASQ